MNKYKNIKEGQLVLMQWEDHASDGGWSKIEDTCHAICTVNTVGWVVRNSETYLTVSFMKQEYNDVVGDRITIIKSCIKKLKKLNEIDIV